MVWMGIFKRSFEHRDLNLDQLIILEKLQVDFESRLQEEFKNLGWGVNFSLHHIEKLVEKEYIFFWYFH